RQDYMPQVVAEALSTGLPVLAANVGDISDLVRDGITGFLLPYGSPSEHWATVVRRLAANQNELLMLRKSARQFAEQNLSLERFEQGVRTGIEGLLQRNSSH
ncbi:MAG: glycosyltransferase, partial [Bryobacterales bacterium]|nr:glycosyltransferase [Bryobacterales bacterium]